MRLLLQYQKSYTAGLLQSKAFRILKKKTNDVLEPLDVNATDWGVLGLLLKAPEGLRLSEISKEVGVKAPYITRSIDNLEAKRYVEVLADDLDSRARRAFLTPTGKQFMISTEKLVVKKLKVLFKNVPVRDLLGYVRTLDSIVFDFENDAQEVELSHIIDL